MQVALISSDKLWSDNHFLPRGGVKNVPFPCSPFMSFKQVNKSTEPSSCLQKDISAVWKKCSHSFTSTWPAQWSAGTAGYGKTTQCGPGKKQDLVLPECNVASYLAKLLVGQLGTCKHTFLVDYFVTWKPFFYCVSGNQLQWKVK